MGITTPKQDLKLQGYVDYVNAYILKYCDTDFETHTVLEKRITSYDGHELIIPDYPVISVQAVKLFNETALASTSYYLTEQGSVESYTLPLVTSRFAYYVDYIYGYETVPRDLETAALEWIVYLDKREYNRSRSTGNGQTSDYGDPELIPPQIRVALSQYRRV